MHMTDRTTVHGLQVANELYNFVNQEVLPGTGTDQGAFWKGFADLVNDLAPRNAALLAERYKPLVATRAVSCMTRCTARMPSARKAAPKRARATTRCAAPR